MTIFEWRAVCNDTAATQLMKNERGTEGMGAFISGGRNLADGAGGLFAAPRPHHLGEWREVEELCPTPGTWPMEQGDYSPLELRRLSFAALQLLLLRPYGVLVVVAHHSLSNKGRKHSRGSLACRLLLVECLLHTILFCFYLQCFL
jgi:hypothetical protein